MCNSQSLVKRIIAFVLVFAISTTVVSYTTIGSEKAYASSTYSFDDFWNMFISYITSFNTKEEKEVLNAEPVDEIETDTIDDIYVGNPVIEEEEFGIEEEPVVEEIIVENTEEKMTINEIIDSYKCDDISGYLVETINNIGYYFNCEEAKDAKIYYKAVDEEEWKKAYEPVYSSVDGQYRGSIVDLKENTAYEVALVVTDDINYKSSILSVTTWEDEVTVARTIRLSDYCKEEVLGVLKVSAINGTEDGYINVICDIPLNSNISKRAAILTIVDGNVKVSCYNNSGDIKNTLVVEKSSYTQVSKANVKGGIDGGVVVWSNSSNIRISDCEISEFGPYAATTNEYNVPYDADGNKIQFKAGVRLVGVGKVVVENCYIHSPNTASNYWDEDTTEITHPAGIDGFYIQQSKGQLVIRNNTVVGKEDFRFNDIITGWKNEAVEGGFAMDCDIYGNYFAYGNDDGIEIDGGQKNIRVYENRIEHTFSGISCAPNLAGPSYIFRNEIVNLSDQAGRSSYAIKNVYSNLDQTIYGTTFVFNNTFYGNFSGFEIFREASRSSRLVSRNNIIVVTGKEYGLSNHYSDLNDDFDYDMIYNIYDKELTIRDKNAGFEINGLFELPQFINEKEGDFALESNSPGIGAALELDNFCEELDGRVPDMGARQSFSSSWTYGIL